MSAQNEFRSSSALIRSLYLADGETAPKQAAPASSRKPEAQRGLKNHPAVHSCAADPVED
jgi:hypothetical protein